MEESDARGAELANRGNTALKSYLQLCRVSNLPTVWSNVVTGVLLSGGHATAWLYLLLVFSLCCFYLAGMALNDLCDLEHDRAARPSRPIPSGTVSQHGAQVVTSFLLLTGFAPLAYAPSLSGAAAAALLLIAIVAYDLYHKQHPASILVMGGCRFLIYAVAALAVTGRLAPPVLAAGGIQFLYIVAVTLFARHERQLRLGSSPMPLLLASICLVDGTVLAFLAGPKWLIAGAACFAATLAGQRYVRGD